MNTFNAKIIYFMSQSPPYEEYADKPKPKYVWNTSEGNWVGIWGYDWADLLAIEVRKINDNFEHEIWQPDIRADQVYSKEIYPGVTHRLFPASVKKVQFGFKKIERMNLSNLIAELKRESCHSRRIVQIGSFYQLKLLKESGCTDKIIFSFTGDIWLPMQRFFAFMKNLPAKVNLLKEHWDFKKSVKILSAVTYMNDKNLELLKRYYPGPLEKITMGADFDYWRKLDKNSSRHDLQLPIKRTILFTSSRLNDLKQVDRFVQVLKRLSQKHDFLFVVSGHGTRQYEDYLRAVSQPLLEQNKIEFVGYIQNDKLIKYYCACDLFVLTSLSEGASVSVIKALACETPVFSTAVGNTAEVLREHGAGIIVPQSDYASWEIQLDNFLSGGHVATLPSEIAREHYHWPNIAKKFNDVYNSVI